MNFFMELAEATEVKATKVKEKATSNEREAYEAEVRASEVEQEFQEMRRCHDVAIKEVIHSKKLKEATEWLASMHKRMTKACQMEARVVEEARVEITNLKESLRAKVPYLKEDTHAQVHWLWDEISSIREKNRWLWNELRQARS